MTNTLTDTAVKVAIAALDSEAATPIEKIEMLLEMATRLQHKPQDEHPLIQAIVLYDHALEVGGETYPLLKARALAGKATALRSLPEEGPDRLLEAKTLYEAALPLLTQHGAPEEKAETQMNLGLVMQSLVPYHQARLADCIRLYQQALEVFTGKAYPQEYAILQNNIAIAYLSMASTTGRDDLKQAIAVQTFEQALTVITLIDHPSEYAMLQNNLGNALQYLPSTHSVENNLRALTAYDEALKVRTAKDTPLPYAHTLANRANVLVNLPDDLEHPEWGNQRHLQQAGAHYLEAEHLFLAYGQFSQAKAVRQAHEALSQSLAEAMPEVVN
ncbi:MAG: hypothetical protein F6J95_013190 [Leptolyngbya sp. SIO1E4]|nr:hypothetical protein [Leptolyngbya sp. SIO1E4]